MPFIIELPKCGVCSAEYKTGEVVAGVRIGYEVDPKNRLLLINPGTYYEGHYDCVVDALGPVETLKALQAGILPTRPVAMEGGVMPDPATGLLIKVDQPGPKA
jgi:hypothetical protein